MKEKEEQRLINLKQYENELRNKGYKCTNVHSHDEACNYLKSKIQTGDVVLTVGAGDVVLVGEKLLQK